MILFFTCPPLFATAARCSHNYSSTVTLLRWV